MLRRSQFRNDDFFLFGDRRHSVSMLKLSDSSFDFPVTLYTTFVLSLELKPDLSIMSALAGKQRQHGSDPEDDSSKEESNSEGHQISSAEKGSKDERPPQLVGFCHEADHYKYVCISSRPQLEPVMELDWVLFGAPERTDFCIGPRSSNLIGGLEWIRGLRRS